MVLLLLRSVTSYNFDMCTTYIRAAGREALYTRFWILPLEGDDDTRNEGLGFWWGVGEGGGAPEGRQGLRVAELKEGIKALPSCPFLV